MWQFPGSTQSVRDVRAQSRRLLDGRVSAELLDDVVLIVSELATNAVLHAGGAYSVRVSVEAGEVLVAVTDSSRREPVSGPDHPTIASGRGLHIVESVSRSWGCEAHRPGKTVWARLTGDAPSRTAVAQPEGS